MSKTETKKKNVITLSVAGGIIILIALALVFFVGFFPSVSAKSKFNRQVDSLSDATVNAVTFFAPNAPTDLFEETEVEKVFYDTEKIASLLLSAADKVSFSETGKELSPSDYQYRIRFVTAEGKLDFYLKDGRIFISESGIRYYFISKDSSAYAALKDHLDSVFEIKKS